MSDTGFRESITTPYLRPAQTVELQDEKGRLAETLKAPAFIRRQIQNLAALENQYRNISRTLETQSALPYGTENIDKAIAREKELRESFTEDMPTAEEMRRNPPGAVDRHRLWESRHKLEVLEWKNIQLRLHASGAFDSLPDASDIANIEKYRPHGGSGELSMDNAQIPRRREHHGLGASAVGARVMSDAEAAMLKSMNPKLFARMALLSNDQRTEVLKIVDRVLEGKAGEGNDEANGGAAPKLTLLSGAPKPPSKES